MQVYLERVRVLFASAELAPFAKVGGLGDFSSGLTKVLRDRRIEVDIVMPDYEYAPIDATTVKELTVPEFARPSLATVGHLGEVAVTALSVPGIRRPNPYVDADGAPWPDNDSRFLGFSAAVAAWSTETRPDVIHLNDWHTAAVLGFADDPPPSLLTIHNLAYQGNAGPEWLDVIPYRRDEFLIEDETNPLAGGIALADRVVAVSEHYARETRADGFGLDGLLRSRGEAYLGILNGIDTEVWDPETDPHLEHRYGIDSLGEKEKNKAGLLAEVGWDEHDGPLIGMVTRLTDQKGVDIALAAVPAIQALGGRLILLGSGERGLSDAAAAASERFPRVLHFHDGFDEGLAHRIFGGSNMFLMPSRFEPAGLTQMQAMRYGVIPVVTDVGGLHDTVVDADARPDEGTGFRAVEVTPGSVADALARAVTAWRDGARRDEIVRRGMTIDWSWSGPADRYISLYEEITSAR